MPVSTECAAALLSFRYPSLSYKFINGALLLALAKSIYYLLNQTTNTQDWDEDSLYYNR